MQSEVALFPSHLDEILDDPVHVLSVESHLRELRRFHLQAQHDATSHVWVKGQYRIMDVDLRACSLVALVYPDLSPHATK